MNCPHCGQEHPDIFQFCPITGQIMAPRFMACINKQCLDYGKYILPLDSRFCPSCGNPLDNQIGENDNSNDANDVLSFTINGISFNMILVKHGCFMMGATEEQKEPNNDEKPVHKVIITKNYYIGETQVTQRLWNAIMGDNPSYFKGNNRPVESVSWDECQIFINVLNSKLRTKLAGKKFRLPTEAEWEFAARGGNNSDGFQYAFSDNLCEVAWCSKNSDGKTHPVAQLKPNELDIYDMNGNVWEWCQDWYGKYSLNSQTNPKGPSRGDYCVIRCGSWNVDNRDGRLSYRNCSIPHGRHSGIGLRLVLSE